MNDAVTGSAKSFDSATMATPWARWNKPMNRL